MAGYPAPAHNGRPRSPVVYRCYNAAGDLLYVGMSEYIDQRLTQHSTQTSWWPDVDDITVQACESKDAAVRTERLAILTEDPIHNVRRMPVVPEPIRY